MAVNKILGVYFGPNSLSIVETQKKTISNFFDAPHGLFDQNERTGQGLPDEIRLTAIIQKTLRDKKINISEINLCLPTKDIILRSFFIPWMTSQEVRGVVDFEARRYIPFKLDELAYGYHSQTITEKHNRRIRITFFAVRKTTLEQYNSILAQANLSVVAAEPAPLSLLRLLTFKKHIHTQKTSVIIQVNNTEGSILIVDHGIPQFVRDFRLTAGESNAILDPGAINLRLLSEIRISLDYYRRQQAQENIEKILLLAVNPLPELLEILERDTGIKTGFLNAKTILGLDEEIDIGVLNAFGVGLKNTAPYPVNINLVLPAASKAAEEPEKVFEQSPLDLKSIIKTAAVCAVVLLAVFIFTKQGVSNSQRHLNTVKTKVGIYEALTTEDIRKNNQDALSKLEGYKGTRFNSEITFLLSTIPELLPEGVWLTQFRINYVNSPSVQADKKTAKGQVNLTIAGYSYSPESSQQIHLINKLIANFRENKKLVDFFGTIELSSTRQQQREEGPITEFQITCR